MKFMLTTLLLSLSCSAVASSEIDAAREGAPEHVSSEASVMVWEKDRYVEKVPGKNQFMCLVWADQKGTFEPSCFNKAARKAILPVYQYQRKMLQTGQSIKDIHAAIARKAESGEFPKPEPGALVYMTSKRNKYYDHWGQALYDIEPHIMLYYPKLVPETLGFNGKNGLPDHYDDFPHLSVVHLHSGEHH